MNRVKALAAVAVFAWLLPPGTAHATTIYACYGRTLGLTRIVPSLRLCNPHTEIPISWNQQGPQGPAGPSGSPGATGAQGVQGPAGLQGIQGPMGLMGAQGPAGPAGTPGPIGLTGVAGPQGPTGATGSVGPQGPKGDKGDPGTGGGLICTTAPNIYLVTALNGTQTCKAQYLDNGDGTVTDNQTGLMWEKKTAAGTGDVHDVNNTYTPSTGPPWNRDGTLYSSFLAALNSDVSAGGSSTCFANHCDWRMPNIAELQGILLAPYPCSMSPCIDAAFGPTRAAYYYSSSLLAGNPANTWDVYFLNGLVNNSVWNYTYYARAVRGGR